MFRHQRRVCCCRRTGGGVWERSQRIGVVLRHQQVPPTGHSAERLFHGVLAMRAMGAVYNRSCCCFACFGLLMMHFCCERHSHRLPRLDGDSDNVWCGARPGNATSDTTRHTTSNVEHRTTRRCNVQQTESCHHRRLRYREQRCDNRQVHSGAARRLPTGWRRPLGCNRDQDSCG